MSVWDLDHYAESRSYRNEVKRGGGIIPDKFAYLAPYDYLEPVCSYTNIMIPTNILHKFIK